MPASSRAPSAPPATPLGERGCSGRLGECRPAAQAHFFDETWTLVLQ